MLRKIGSKLARYLSRPRAQTIHVATSAPSLLAKSLRPGDILLVEGNTIFSTAIKYLTQSSWSHAALYVGDALLPAATAGDQRPQLIEADINDGVRCVELSYYHSFHTRICRPVGLSPEETDAVINFAVNMLGHQYDLRNIFDLARYLLPQPPVPARYRRKLLALGSGDPTLAICSSLIAQAFQSIRYPILPESIVRHQDNPTCRDCYQEMLHIRHHSLFTPRDFDVSPYFKIIKPTLTVDFDFHTLEWADV
ncbi:YiiX/YebB-like N1pC/P60 family cysteine hydrolase [Desulforhopalus sp. IMCC35007]|uniref:YiiX/YebB-like N1pC/P60 family cysteine hydrolase n=1 Tax=Desulforhopalus sp. IMCC35007 TaxID=2569543 RepID=UPI0010AE5C34|nr:YiiX/YebB-like N1pC/P60 family cysteine hydrolase [Desulforhopalus sp. IMCC35007]TKB05792.1 lipo-like protein [Desulforhopalus sp. IMCC35007]